MTVAILVQSDAGDVADANAYVAVAFYKSYHALRGNDVGTQTDDDIASRIIRATDFMDGRWRFPGSPLLATQTTQWPREACVGQPLHDRNGNDITGIPRALKNACAEYAFRAGTALLSDVRHTLGGGPVKRTTDKVDVLETTIEYDTTPGAKVMEAYPIADNMLRAAGLVSAGGVTLVR